MITFDMKLADQHIRVHCQYPETYTFCKDYLLAGEAKPPVLEVSVGAAECFYEQEKSEAEDRREGIPIRRFPATYLETLALYRQIAEVLIDRGILLFHGSLIAVDGRGYLFTAKSGTGKSTHTGLWRQVFGERAVMVNDDKPLLGISPRGVTAYGTPWDGKHHLSRNMAVPLQGLCILKRNEGEGNRIRRMSPGEAYPMLLQQSYRSREGLRLQRSLALLDSLADGVPLYELYADRTPDAVWTAYKRMQEDRERCD